MALKIWWPRIFHHGFENMVPVICIASFPGPFKNSTFQTSLGMRLVMSSTEYVQTLNTSYKPCSQAPPSFPFLFHTPSEEKLGGAWE